MPDQNKTNEIHEWMKSLDDDTKMRFVLNWRQGHALFNVACKLKHSDELQDVDWHSIYKSWDLGLWSHGGKVYLS